MRSSSRAPRVQIVQKDDVETFQPHLPTPPLFEPGENMRVFLISKRTCMGMQCTNRQQAHGVAVIGAERACYKAPEFARKLEASTLRYLKMMIMSLD